MTKKSLTNEQLAAMVAREFAATKDLVKSESSALSAKIDAMDLKLSAQTTSWRDDFRALDERVSLNETDIKALNNVVYKKS
ncbi:MAG: hypothetical protein AAB667_02005 [Patescibacteria group bacterium]